MEPNLIDYYNNFPSAINIIDKLNEEYTDLESKYTILECKFNYFKKINSRYIAPIIISKNYDEFINFNKFLLEKFPKKLEEILKNEKYGILNILHNAVYRDLYNILERCSICIDKIINELNEITNNKNKEWCKDRIKLSFESCLKKYENVNSLNIEIIINNLINHIMNINIGEFLPIFYTETVETLTNYKYNSELFFKSILSLNCFVCDKCKSLCNNLDNNKNILLCCNCG